jgi:ketosteroid isomerase-like protein
MDETEEFLAAVLPAQEAADTALHNGDAGPRKALWSHTDPVTVLGAARSAVGWQEVESLFDWLASSFSNCVSHRCEVIAAAASSDFGYILGHEHTTASVGGQEPAPYELRVTLIFRREGGQWKEAHRHADPWPGAAGTQEQLARLSP